MSTTSQTLSNLLTGNEEFILYSWSEKSGFDDPKDQCAFLVLDKLSRKLKTWEEGKDFASNADVKELFKTYQSGTKKGSSGPLTKIARNKDDDQRFVKTYHTVAIRVLRDTFNLSMSKYKNNFNMNTNASLEKPSTPFKDPKDPNATTVMVYSTEQLKSIAYYNECKKVDSMVSAQIDAYNRVLLTLGADTLTYKPMIDEQGILTVSIKMAREQSGSEFVSKGVPAFKKVNDWTKMMKDNFEYIAQKEIVVNGKRYLAPLSEEDKKKMTTPIDIEMLKVDYIHNLFGKGAIAYGCHRWDWSYSVDRIIAIKPILCGDILNIIPKAPSKGSDEAYYDGFNEALSGVAQQGLVYIGDVEEEAPGVITDATKPSEPKMNLIDDDQ
jgi:hypothetical protein